MDTRKGRHCMRMHIEHQAGISNFVERKHANSTLFDLQWQVVWFHLSTNYAPAKIAQLMSVSERTVWCCTSLFNCTGDIQPQKRRNGPRMLMGDFEQITLPQQH